MLKSRSLLYFLFVLLLLIPTTLVHAQDTPKPLRDAAIADLNTRIPGIGNPQGWSHVIVTATDTFLGCTLLGTGDTMARAINVYVITLIYPSNEYIYRVAEDGSRVIACDPQLLGGTVPTPIATSCPNNALGLSKLQPRDQAITSIPDLPVRISAGSGSQQVTTLPQGTAVFIIDGPACDGQFLWWFIDYGGARGYMSELNYVNPQTFLTRIVTTEPFPTGPVTNGTTYQSATCPLDFAGYLTPRLFVGGTGQVEGGGVNNIIRQNYGRSSQVTGIEMPPGSTFQVIAGPECTGATLGEAIVWWQVNYQGTIGWTAESLNGEYFLQPFGVGGEVAPTTSTAPSATLPTTRIPISSANAAQLSQLGQLTFAEYFPLISLGSNGTLSVGVQNHVYVYNSVSNPQLTTKFEIPLQDADYFEALSPFGDFLAVSDFTASATNPSTQIVLWDTVVGTEGSRLPPLATGAFNGITFSHNSLYVVFYYETLTTTPATFTTSLMSLPTGNIIPLTHNSPIVNAVFSPDDKLLATYSTIEDVVYLWDATTNTQIGTAQVDVIPAVNSGANAPAALAFSPDGTLLAVGGESGTVQLWDVASRSLKTTLTVFQPGQGTVLTIAFSPDGKLLAAAGGFLNISTPSTTNQITVFDTTTNTALAVLTGHTDIVGRLAFSPDGALLFSSGDNSVRIWGVK